MKMVFIKFKPDGKEYGFGVPEDYKGRAALKPGSWVRVPVPGCRKKMLRVVVRVAETATPPEGLKMIGYSGRQIAQTANKKARRAAHQGGIIYLAKRAKAEKRAMLGGRPIDLAWEAEKAAWIEDDLDIEPYLAKGYNTDEGLPKLTELRLGMRMGFDESSYDDPALPLHIIKKRRFHQLRDWAKEQGLLPPHVLRGPCSRHRQKPVAGTADRHCQRHHAGHLRPKAHQAAQMRPSGFARNAPVPRSWYDRRSDSPLLGAWGQKAAGSTCRIPKKERWKQLNCQPARAGSFFVLCLLGTVNLDRQFDIFISLIHNGKSKHFFPINRKKLLTNRPSWNILMVQTKFT